MSSRERNPGREVCGKDGGVPEALVMVGLLSAVGLIFLLVWLSWGLSDSWSSGKADTPGRGFLAGVALGLLLADFAILILMFRRPRTPSACRIFGVGILMGLFSMVVTAFLLRAHIGDHAQDLFLPWPDRQVTVAVLILILGTMGVLLITMGLILRRADATPNVGLPGEIALLLLGVAALLLFAYETAWSIYSGIWTDSFPTDLLKAGPGRFITAAAGAAAALLAAIIFVPRSREGRPRHLFSLPVGTVLVVVLMMLSSWVISRGMVGSGPVRPQIGFTIEFLMSLFRSTADAPRGQVDWGLVRGVGLILVGVVEVVFRLLGRKTADPRPTLVLRWLSGAVAGGLLLLSAAALNDLVAAVFRFTDTVTPRDFTLLPEACAAFASLLPVYLFATLLAATRPFESGRIYRLLNRTGLALLALGVMACVTWAAMWWTMLEVDVSVGYYRHLLTASRFLWWGAVGYLVAVTFATVVEFVRVGRSGRG